MYCKQDNHPGCLNFGNVSKLTFDCYLYELKITTKELVFYKYGLTKTPDRRVGSLKSSINKYYSDVDIEILNLYKNDVKVIFNIEQKIHDSLKASRVHFQNKFEGYSECFTNRININDYLPKE